MINTEVELAWAIMEESNNTELKKYVDFLTTDITFSEAAIKSGQTGRVHPTRLNGLKAVGPLESLAGARPTNSIQVVFEPGSVSVADGKLWINKPTSTLFNTTKRKRENLMANEKRSLFHLSPLTIGGCMLLLLEKWKDLL
jgi:hypothetical protein